MSSYGEMANMGGGTARVDEKRVKKANPLSSAEVPALKMSTSGGSALSDYAISKKPAGGKAAFGMQPMPEREEANERQVRQALADEKRRIMKAMEQ